MTELTKKESQIDLFKTNHPTGFEGTTQESFKPPFLKILETLSPQVLKSKPEYIEGAKAGTFFNTTTNKFYDALNVIVLKISHELTAWAPKRQGFRGTFPKYDEDRVVAKREGLKKWDAEGNELQDTMYFYLMNIDDPSEIAVLPLSIVRFKDARNWATRLRGLSINGSIIQVSWAGVWKISLLPYSNDKGEWHSIGNTPEFIRFITEEERDRLIIPAIELLKNAQLDYSELEKDKSDEANLGDVNF